VCLLTLHAVAHPEPVFRAAFLNSLAGEHCVLFPSIHNSLLQTLACSTLSWACRLRFERCAVPAADVRTRCSQVHGRWSDRTLCSAFRSCFIRRSFPGAGCALSAF
jgi:hypothetical protein